MPLPVGAWTCRPLFGHGFGMLVCFHSVGVRGGMSAGWEILVLKRLEPPPLPFSFSFLKTKEKILTELVILCYCPKYGPALRILLAEHSALQKSCPVPVWPGHHHFHLTGIQAE